MDSGKRADRREWCMTSEFVYEFDVRVAHIGASVTYTFYGHCVPVHCLFLCVCPCLCLSVPVSAWPVARVSSPCSVLFCQMVSLPSDVVSVPADVESESASAPPPPVSSAMSVPSIEMPSDVEEEPGLLTDADSGRETHLMIQ